MHNKEFFLYHSNLKNSIYNNFIMNIGATFYIFYKVNNQSNLNVYFICFHTHTHTHTHICNSKIQIRLENRKLAD